MSGRVRSKCSWAGRQVCGGHPWATSIIDNNALETIEGLRRDRLLLTPIASKEVWPRAWSRWEPGA
jgi:hypothetical protein